MISAFPKDSILISASFEVFKGTRESLFLMVPLVMVIRTVLNMIMMQGHSQHMKVVGDTILFFIGVYSLESLMLLIMEIPASAQDLIANTDQVALDKIPDKFFLFSLAMGLSDLFDYCTIIVFHILSIVYLLMMSIAIILGGYVVFFATMFQVRKVFTVFVMIIFFLSLWPFIWYSLDKTFEHILRVQNENGSAAGAAVSVVMLSLLKLCVPVAGFMAALKAPVGMMATAGAAIKSGAAPFKSSLQGASSVGKSVGLNQTASFMTAPVRSAVGNRIGGLKQAAQSVAPYAAYKTSQLINHRKKAGMESFQSFKSRVSNHASQSISNKTKSSTSFSSNYSSTGRLNTKTESIQKSNSFAESVKSNQSAQRSENKNKSKHITSQTQVTSYERIGVQPQKQSYERMGFDTPKNRNERDI